MTISIAGSSNPFLKQLETNNLTASKAAPVKKTMDNLAGGSASATDASQVASTDAAYSQAGGSSGAGKAGGGAGGRGGSSTNTELSEVVTDSGSTITTAITYTDGTTSTTATTTTDADKAKYEKSSPGDQTQGTASEYSPAIDRGALTDKVSDCDDPALAAQQNLSVSRELPLVQLDTCGARCASKGSWRSRSHVHPAQWRFRDWQDDDCPRVT